MPDSPTPFLPYGRQTIDDADIQAVTDVLRSDWLTTGPAVQAFEEAFRDIAGTQHAAAVNNGTSALHAAYHAIGLGPGDDVVVPAITFAATANAALYCGARPIFADVDPLTLLVTPETVAAAITPDTKAIVGVDYAGQPCDHGGLRRLARSHGAWHVADACHALGGSRDGVPVGSHADVSTFSFHPVKPIATGEGGMVVTEHDRIDRRVRQFRNHGITTDHRQRAASGTVHYDQTDLGHNLRLSDIHAALGTSQLRHLEAWTRRRQSIAALYRDLLFPLDITALDAEAGVEHAYHLFVVRVPDRDGVAARLRDAGIGTAVHYKPVYKHSYYQHQGLGALCPVAEKAYEEILSLPIHPGMSDDDVRRVVACLEKALP